MNMIQKTRFFAPITLTLTRWPRYTTYLDTPKAYKFAYRKWTFQVKVFEGIWAWTGDTDKLSARRTLCVLRDSGAYVFLIANVVSILTKSFTRILCLRNSVYSLAIIAAESWCRATDTLTHYFLYTLMQCVQSLFFTDRSKRCSSV